MRHATFHYKVFKIELDGTLSNAEHLNEDELDTWLNDQYGKLVNIRVERSDGKWIHYTDNGEEFDVVERGQQSGFTSCINL